MNRLKTFLLLLFSASSVLGVDPPKSPFGQKEIFEVLRNRLASIRETPLPKAQPAVTRFLGTSVSNVQFLEDRAKDQVVPAVYLISLTGNAYALDIVKETAVLEKAGQKEVQMLANVDADLETKVSFAKENPSKAFQSVRVVAHTKDTNGTEIPGYEVWYVAKAVRDYPAEHKEFNSLSTPTKDQKIAPGNYYMWSKKDAKKGEDRPVDDLGRDGESKRDVDLKTP